MCPPTPLSRLSTAPPDVLPTPVTNYASNTGNLHQGLYTCRENGIHQAPSLSQQLADTELLEPGIAAALLFICLCAITVCMFLQDTKEGEHSWDWITCSSRVIASRQMCLLSTYPAASNREAYTCKRIQCSSLTFTDPSCLLVVWSERFISGHAGALCPTRVGFRHGWL